MEGRARALIGAALVLACGGVRSGPDELVVAVNTPPQKLDPRRALTSQDLLVSRLAYAGLTTTDTPDGTPAPLLAESIEREAPGRWVATLRADARFWDGTPVGAADVVFSYPALHPERIDERRVRFALPEPSATLPADLEAGVVDRKGQGAGAFSVVRVAPRETELAANPHWAFGAPRLRRVVFRSIEDASARLLALAGGSVDLTHAVDPLVVDALLENPALKARRAPSSYFAVLGMNLDDPLLRDARVRRAIAMAIDREGLVAAKLGGRGSAVSSIIPRWSWGYAGEVRLPPYDPAAAHALLAEAGALGHPVVVRAWQSLAGAARPIVRQLDEAGLRAELRLSDTATLLTDARKGNFQLAIIAGVGGAEPDALFRFFHPSSIPARGSSDAVWNLWRYRDGRVAELLATARRTEDREARKKIYAEVQRQLAEDLPVVPLYQSDLVAIMRRDVEGYEPSPTSHYCPLARVWKRR